MNYEMLIERARQAAKETVCIIEPRTLNRLADALENQERFIQGLQEIIKQQGGVNLRAADMALELDAVKAELVDERDVVIKRMIELAIEHAHALEDFKRSLMGEPCEYCGNCFGFNDGRCDEAALDCEKCRHTDCPCHDCLDLDKWVWRGVKQATASNSQVTEPLQRKAFGDSEETIASDKQVKKERDALLQELRGMCNKCVHYHNGQGDSVCRGCEDQNWEWTGPKEE